jgi:hypothetical protein
MFWQPNILYYYLISWLGVSEGSVSTIPHSNLPFLTQPLSRPTNNGKNVNSIIELEPAGDSKTKTLNM